MHAFALLEKENESILFCCRQDFSQISLTTLVIQSKISCRRQKLIDKKVIDFILPRLSTALHKVTIAKRNFHPSGLFDYWRNGVRRLLTVEKEEASIFQAADLATTVADMFIELYC